MSRRITIETELTDLQALQQACEALSLKHSVNGDTLTIQTGGYYGGYSFDTRTGKMTGDEDYMRGFLREGLHQQYSKALVMRTMFEQGHIIEQETVLANGDIEILAKIA